MKCFDVIGKDRLGGLHVVAVYAASWSDALKKGKPLVRKLAAAMHAPVILAWRVAPAA